MMTIPMRNNQIDITEFHYYLATYKVCAANSFLHTYFTRKLWILKYLTFYFESFTSVLLFNICWDSNGYLITVCITHSRHHSFILWTKYHSVSDASVRDRKKNWLLMHWMHASAEFGTANTNNYRNFRNDYSNVL